MLYFVPKQSVLGKYNDQYGNRIYILEYETEGPAAWTGYDNTLEILDTEELQKLKLKHGDKVTLDDAALVRARMFDLLIGDWDRHAKQWGWIVQEKDGLFNATPLPTDRDNAFFNIEGVIPTLLSNKELLPALQKFRRDIDYLPGLVMPFDLYFLKNVSSQVFAEEARTLQSRLSNEVISQAFASWPAAIYNLNGKEIISKIAERREHLVEFATMFKEVIDNKPPLEVPLKGSEDLDLSKEQLSCFECLSSN